MSPKKLGVIFDYPEEGWHSMDLCAQMLVQSLKIEYNEQIETVPICSPFNCRLQRLPFLKSKHCAFNADRLINRFWDYPRYLKRQAKQFDLFHVSDHTYAQLVHVLPPERTGVFCHDIDAFRSLVEPQQEPRPGWYKAMSRRILEGLQKAAVVFYSTEVVRNQIEHYKLVDPSKLLQVPYGISQEFNYISKGSASLDEIVFQKIADKPFILHVGSCIPRKRIDILLEVFAGLRESNPDLQLVKVSGEWTQDQQQQIERLNLGTAIVHLHNLERTEIATLYRHASLVLITSEAEGFGLPLIEAIACGTIVVASDIPVLQEVGGTAAVYCSISDIPTWVNTANNLLKNPDTAPSLNLRLAQAKKYSWSTHAQIIAQTYLQLT